MERHAFHLGAQTDDPYEMALREAMSGLLSPASEDRAIGAVAAIGMGFEPRETHVISRLFSATRK